MVRQFVYVYGVAEISLLSEKNTKCGCTVFFSLKKTTTTNPTHQNNVFLHPAYKIQKGLQKERKKFPEGLGLSAQTSTPWTKPQKISY